MDDDQSYEEVTAILAQNISDEIDAQVMADLLNMFDDMGNTKKELTARALEELKK